MYNSLEDTRTDVHGEACARIAEAVTAEVSKMTLKDIVWEITELKSNCGLLDRVFDLISSEWRKEDLSIRIDDLLDELCLDNLVTFISCLNLEEKVRQMLIETMIDREVSDL